VSMAMIANDTGDFFYAQIFVYVYKSIAKGI
jgi:hypothetical protein